MVFSILSFKICSFYPLSKHWELGDHVYRYIYRQSFPSNQQQNKKSIFTVCCRTCCLQHVKQQATKLNFIRSNTLQIKFVYTIGRAYTLFSMEHNIKSCGMFFWSVWLIKLKIQKFTWNETRRKKDILFPN